LITTADIPAGQRTAADVEAVTGTRPAATISDEVLASIDALQFVDSSPEALRKRLGHGNIYPLNRVEAALRAEFQPARLAALREIGLRLIGQSTPGSPLERGPQEVLVAVWRADQAESLVRRGVRLARQRGARCSVLALQPGPAAHSPAAQALSEWVEAAATAGGASVLFRDSRDAGAAIISAVQELDARHLVLAVPTAGLLERWRGSLLERLAGQLPRVHLHIVAAAGWQQEGAGNGSTEAGSRPQQRRRGPIRVYLGYAPGCGTTTAMLEEANRRRSRGSDVVVGAVDAPDREDIAAELEHLELIGDGVDLDTAAVLARRPEVVCIDDLTAGTTSAERRFAAARRLADAGITVIGTVHLGKLGDSGPDALLDEPALLALAADLELVDVSPSILRDRVRRGEIVPPEQVTEALETTFALSALGAERERAFRLVAEHGERQLAAYTGAADELASAGVADAERRPSIVACAAPWPGMESLIRRSAALAAQVDGEFRVAAVRIWRPGSDEERLLADYGVLTEQLGGEFAVLTAPAPAPALAEFASQHQATELVLNRAQPNPAGRYPVLRELARLVHDTELHVLPVDR